MSAVPASNHPYRRFAKVAALKQSAKSAARQVCENQPGMAVCEADYEPSGWERFPDEKYRNSTPYYYRTLH